MCRELQYLQMKHILAFPELFHGSHETTVVFISILYSHAGNSVIYYYLFTNLLLEALSKI